jgi:hypothetical protein
MKTLSSQLLEYDPINFSYVAFFFEVPLSGSDKDKAAAFTFSECFQAETLHAI